MKLVEYPRLAWLSRGMDAFHEFLNLVNGWVLWIGLAIALTDLLTDGALTSNLAWLVWPWAISQALGVDSFIYHWSGKAGEHIRLNNWKQAAFYLLVVAGLGFVAWQAGFVFNFRQLEHASVNQAIQALGWTAGQWLGIRAGISVVVVVLSGLTRYEKAQQQQQQQQQQPVSAQPVIVDAGPVEAPETPQDAPIIVPANVRSIESATATRSHSGKRARGYINDPRYIIAAASFTRDNPGSSVAALAEHLNVSQGTAQQLRQIARARGEAVWDLYDEIPMEERQA